LPRTGFLSSHQNTHYFNCYRTTHTHFPPPSGSHRPGIGLASAKKKKKKKTCFFFISRRTHRLLVSPASVLFSSSFQTVFRSFPLTWFFNVMPDQGMRCMCSRGGHMRENGLQLAPPSISVIMSDGRGVLCMALDDEAGSRALPLVFIVSTTISSEGSG
jgi:hypothetical protein